MAWLLLFSLSPRNMDNAWSKWARVDGGLQTDGLCGCGRGSFLGGRVRARVCVVRYVRWKVLTAVVVLFFFFIKLWAGGGATRKMENMEGGARDVQLNGKLSSDPATPFFSLSYKELSLSLSLSVYLSCP